MIAVVNLKIPPTSDPIFELEALAVGTVLEFHSRSGVVITRVITGVFRGYRLYRKGGVVHETDVIQFDDGYLVHAGYAWRSVQWRLVA